MSFIHFIPASLRSLISANQRHQRPMPLPIRKHLAVLLLFTGLSLVLTWPLLPHLLTHVPGDGIDDPALAWNLWWAKHSWVDQAGQGGLIANPFPSDAMFYPVGINLAFYTLTLLNGALSIPLQVAASVTLASNLLLLSSFVLSGFGGYLLARAIAGGRSQGEGGRSQVAGGRWQAAGGRGQTAGGRWQGAGGKSQVAGGRWQGAGGKSQGVGDALQVADDRERGGDEKRRGVGEWGAVLAGLVYAFASAKLFYASLGQFNIASSQWLPFAALYLVRILRSPPPHGLRAGAQEGTPNAPLMQTGMIRWRDGLLLGLFLCLQTWAELTYGSFAVLLTAMTVVCVAIWRLARRASFAMTVRSLAPIVLAAGIFAAGLSPYLLNMLPDLQTEGDFLVEGGGFADTFSADVAGFFFPTQLHPLAGGAIRALSQDSALQPDGVEWQVNKGQHIFFGYTVLALALFGLWARRKEAWVWLAAGLTFFFILTALGPSIRFQGHDTGLPGIFPLLLKIPFFQANRYPSRYSVLILLGLSVLVALGAQQVLARARRRRLTAGILAALILFEHLSIPLPLSDFRLPAAYRAIAADPRPGAVLDLPIGWRNGFNVFGKSDVIIMFTQWYQTYHGKSRLGGNTSRNPEHKFQYFLEHPVIGVLAALQDGRTVDDESFRLAQSLGPDLLRFLNIHQVLIHRDRTPADFEQRLTQIFPLTAAEVVDGVARYEARWPAERTSLTLGMDAPEVRTYLKEGWGAPVHVSFDGQPAGQMAVWATRSRVALLLPGLSQPAEAYLDVYAPTAQTLTLRLDGRPAGQRQLAAGPNHLRIPLPPAPEGFPHTLAIAADTPLDPAAVRLAARDIGRAGIASPVQITVRSAGKETGDFGHIYVNGVDISPNQRGYNLAALDPVTGGLLAAANFDTHGPRTAPAPSAALAAWIAALPPDTIVAGAVRDAAGLSLSEEAWQALQTLGVQNDLRGQMRRAHGFVGVKGAAPGTAADFISDLWPVTLAIGDGITAPAPTFALFGLGWTEQP